ncbi:HTH-type transcriptional regulator RutR [Xylophilus sp. Kf1]|nr:HTH-type transcriptional regulator RutR [Xylophilus sp. Kf1]
MEAHPADPSPPKPPAGRRQRQSEDKRKAILDAALTLFSQHGVHGASVDRIASLADVSKGNLLYHFESKEVLYRSVLRQLLALWLEPLRAFSAAQDPRQAIGDYIRRKLKASRDDPQASRLFCLELVQGAPLFGDELSAELRELVERKAQVIRDWTRQGQLGAVEPHHLIFTLWSVTQHYADFAVQVRALTGRTLDDPVFFEETVANVQRIVLDGVLPRGHRPACAGEVGE